MLHMVMANLPPLRLVVLNTTTTTPHPYMDVQSKLMPLAQSLPIVHFWEDGEEPKKGHE